jgi:hypothetical protein
MRQTEREGERERESQRERERERMREKWVNEWEQGSAGERHTVDATSQVLERCHSKLISFPLEIPK